MPPHPGDLAGRLLRARKTGRTRPLKAAPSARHQLDLGRAMDVDELHEQIFDAIGHESAVRELRFGGRWVALANLDDIEGDFGGSIGRGSDCWRQAEAGATKIGAEGMASTEPLEVFERISGPCAGSSGFCGQGRAGELLPDKGRVILSMLEALGMTRSPDGRWGGVAPRVPGPRSLARPGFDRRRSEVDFAALELLGRDGSTARGLGPTRGDDPAPVLARARGHLSTRSSDAIDRGTGQAHVVCVGERLDVVTGRVALEPPKRPGGASSRVARPAGDRPHEDVHREQDRPRPLAAVLGPRPARYRH